MVNGFTEQAVPSDLLSVLADLGRGRNCRRMKKGEEGCGMEEECHTGADELLVQKWH